MAVRLIEERTDDIDGSPGATPVSFSYDGRDYVIDLAGDNLTDFDRFMDDRIKYARRMGGAAPKRRAPRRPGPAGADDVAAAAPPRTEAANIRAWYATSGLDLGTQPKVGAVRRAVRDAWVLAGRPTGV